MAKKRKRNARVAKEQSKGIKIKDIILSKAATEKVMVPDFIQLSKKRQRGTGKAFVHTSCIQEQVSLPRACGACFVPSRENAFRGKQSGKKKYTAAAAIVPSSCITESTTPVYHFYGKVPDNMKTSCKPEKKVKKRKNKAREEFVPASCITNQISRGLPTKAMGGIHKPDSSNICCRQASSYEIVLETRNRRKKPRKPVEFVPQTCITPETAPVRVFVQSKQPEFVNPYPALPAMSPDITGGARNNRRGTKTNRPFIPECCMTAEVSQPYLPAKKAEKTPAVIYRYVDRPNSPDILGPTSKRYKRKRTGHSTFVPQSCTAGTEKPAPVVLQRSDVLAKPVPMPQPKAAGFNWLPAAAVILILLAIAGYVLTK